MFTAGIMLAHLWAAKAVRSAVFLSAWDASRLPAMVFVTAVAVVAAVPVYARLLARFGPGRVVPVGLLLSAAGHLVEWRLSGANPWVAAAIYLHVAGVGALLLSGFWSLASELFDPQSARAGYGRIAAAGTVGGLLGGLAIERASEWLPDDSALLLLAGFHALGAAGAFLLGRQSRVLSPAAASGEAFAAASIFDVRAFRTSPHLRTIALLVGLSTASAFLLEFLFQSGAQAAFSSRADLQQFLARFYVVVGVLTSLAQFGAGASVLRLGLGRTIASLPLGLGTTTALALVFQAFPMVVLVRGIESALRSSLFRSGYELLFVPMDPDQKRRVKAFLDVACDRAGDAIGAVIVQVLLVVAIQLSLQSFLAPTLLALVLVMAAAGFWLSGRLDRLYLDVVEQRLAGQADREPIVVPSEAGWTVIGLPAPADLDRRHLVSGVLAPAPGRREEDPRLQVLAELRSGDRGRVQAVLARMDRPDRMQMAQVASLLAWDDVSVEARAVLERHASRHIGLLVDILVDPATDFAVRRRLPRVLGTVPSPRALDGLIWSLQDERFEVRYQAGRAIDRLLRRHPDLEVDAGSIRQALERELSVPVGVWQARHLLDQVDLEADRDEPDPAMPSGGSTPEGAGAEGGSESGRAATTGAAGRLPGAAAAGAGRNLEHVFTLLSAVLPRDAVQAAYRSLRAADPHLRALAFEYLDRALSPGLRLRLQTLVEAAATSSVGGAREQSGPPPPATRP